MDKRKLTDDFDGGANVRLILFVNEYCGFTFATYPDEMSMFILF